jgi:hypothetical protein
MFAGTRLLAALALAAGVLAGPVGAQEMSGQLGAPAAVPLDFLRRFDRDTNWLAQAMDDLGVAGQYRIEGDLLEAKTSAALKAANRIRSFAYLAAPGLGPPYLDLTLRAEDGSTFRCPTLFPEEVAPGIGAMDFGLESFSAAGADAALVEQCRVDPSKASEYASLDRETFRDRYFDHHGDLRLDFVQLNSDPAFIAAALDRGFFVTQGDLTGRLKIAHE